MSVIEVCIHTLECSTGVTLRIYIILLAGTSIVIPVGYMGQPTSTSLPHIYLWRRLCGRSAPTVFHQRFELGTLGSESQCSSTELSWDLYVKGGDNVVNAEGRPNEIGQSWCLADLNTL